MLFPAAHHHSYKLYPLLVVSDVEFSLEVSRKHTPKEGSHAVMVYGHSIGGFTPANLERLWLFTGMFVPMLAIDGTTLSIGEGVSNDFWRRSCLWFFCPETATREIKRLVENNIQIVDSSKLLLQPIRKDTELQFSFPDTPDFLLYTDDLTKVEAKFLDGCLVRIPRTLFHLSFWCVDTLSIPAIE